MSTESAGDVSLKWGWLGAAALLIVTLSLWWWNSGYGKVSESAYQVSQSVLSACLSRSESRLASVETLLAEDREPALEISDRERKWLQGMVQTARSGDWESAANAARRMMEDQVEY